MMVNARILLFAIFVYHHFVKIDNKWTNAWIVYGNAYTGLGRSKFLPKPLPQEINMLLSECDIGEKSPPTASITATTTNVDVEKSQNLQPTAVGCVDSRNANNLDTSLDDDDDDDNRIGWVLFVFLYIFYLYEFKCACPVYASVCMRLCACVVSESEWVSPYLSVWRAFDKRWFITLAIDRMK